jgi:hypothetical protein
MDLNYAELPKKDNAGLTEWTTGKSAIAEESVRGLAHSKILADRGTLVESALALGLR